MDCGAEGLGGFGEGGIGGGERVTLLQVFSAIEKVIEYGGIVIWYVEKYLR